MKLPASNETFRGAIVGKSGSGKSNAAKAWLARELKMGRRCVAFDWSGEYHRGSTVELTKAGPLRDLCTVDELVFDPRKWLDREDLSLCVKSSGEADEAGEEFAEFIAALMATGNAVVVADEFGRYGFDGANAEAAKAAANSIACDGRKRRLNPLFVSQRMVHIPLTARGECNAVEFFLQTSPPDLRALDDLTAPHEFSPRVSSLGPGESVVWLDPMQERRVSAQEKKT